MSGCRVFRRGVPSSQSSSVIFSPGRMPVNADLDIAVRLQPGEADQVFGKAEDADRFTHVENKGLTTALHRSRLQHKIDSFRDGHEETEHIGVRNRDWTAVRDLLLEDRDDGAAAAQHVPKTDNREGAL